MFRQQQSKTNSELVRAELGETVDHAMRAAGHAAGGIRATVGPKVAPTAERFRNAATGGWGSTRAVLGPLTEAAQGDKRARARAQRRSRGARLSRFAGLLAAGVAVGAAAAVVMRWRRQQQWEQYEVEETFETPPPEEVGLTTPPSGTAPDGPSVERQSRPMGARTADNRRAEQAGRGAE